MVVFGSQAAFQIWSLCFLQAAAASKAPSHPSHVGGLLWIEPVLLVLSFFSAEILTSWGRNSLLEETHCSCVGLSQVDLPVKSPEIRTAGGAFGCGHRDSILVFRALTSPPAAAIELIEGSVELLLHGFPPNHCQEPRAHGEDVALPFGELWDIPSQHSDPPPSTSPRSRAMSQ